ncbi:MAG: DUF368 domain-containing protein, partial [Pseudomonadales bacterium]
MGAADVVPGVSGGTIAFISGIYQRLLDAIRAFSPGTVQLLAREGVPTFWRRVDGTFLLVLMAGIITSVLLLARLITVALASYPTCVWAFFFGLIVASSWFLARQVNWRVVTGSLFLTGLAVALVIGELRPTQLDVQPLIIFGSGALAICAMILPGISGSFILLLLGMYSNVLQALHEFDLGFIAMFAAGCGVGLLSFSHVLGFLLSRFHGQTLALLTGFLAGSLAMVWPWQQVISSYVKDDGRTVALQTQNVLPGDYAALTQQDSYTLAALALAILAVLLVLGLEKLATQPE